MFVLLLTGMFCPGQSLPISSCQIVDSGFCYIAAGCKATVPVKLYKYGKLDSIAIKPVVDRKSKSPTVLPSHIPLLTVHGNVMYDFYYQSNIDTPYAEKDIYQHTLQTSLTVTIRNQYPFHIGFSAQEGNSRLFRNIIGVNLQYFSRDLKSMMLARAQQWDAARLKQLQELSRLQNKLSDLQSRLSTLKGWLSSSARVQSLVEEREKNAYGLNDSLSIRMNRRVLDKGTVGWNESPMSYQQGFKGLDSTFPGSKPKSKVSRVDASSGFEQYYYAKRYEADSIINELNRVRQQYEKLEQKIGQRKQGLMDILTKSRNSKELSDVLDGMGLPDSLLPRGYRTLLAIRSLGIGRTMVNYSELTAKDISLNGLQIEFNPSYYVAIATGAVDYRFRNFVINENRVAQYLSMIRLGTGRKEGNNIIFSYYQGKKQTYNIDTSGASETINMHSRIMGIALEGRWQINRTTSFSGEVAKSSVPFNSTYDEGKGILSSMINMGDRSNEAYAASFNTEILRTHTSIGMMYKMMGNNFQSFSLYTTGSKQTAWNIKIGQALFKRHLILTGVIRKNDYVSYLMPVTYNSNTVFRSIQATLRIPRWPSVTIGYQPTSQLMKLTDGHYTEQLFNTFIGTASHYYQWHELKMSSVLTFSQFYNKKTDSNFVYFNSKNLVASQTFFLHNLTLNGTISAAINEEYALYGACGDASWRIWKWLEVGGGVKYNRQTVYRSIRWGYSGSARVQVPIVGEFALMVDKGFIPGINKNLVSNNIGRITYTKNF
ncbi:hypothetical protein CLV59_1076 [Chitinophaga dinghuensis]|uniref:Uncharacterized protein n=1 Tax=Chitinophaga dinghuensis TaxID=1539050 RepID=A0A327VPS5_9BACT|nr:hypothetical protein CLV59_1076 [Chitinophaga dinghuensis]